MKEGISKATLWDWVKAIAVLAIVGVILWKVLLTPVDLTVDFPTLLSLLLALFSVGLASLFYFKATETSNTFYDNTYKFTRDITTLLSKIESGFGEKLRNLDEGYASIRDAFRTNNGTEEGADKSDASIKDEKKEVQKYIEERNAIVRRLIEQSKLEKDERERIAQELTDKDQKLQEAQSELSRLKRRRSIEWVRRGQRMRPDVEDGVIGFTVDAVLPKLGFERILRRPSLRLKHEFDQLAPTLPRGYISDLENHDFFDNGLTDDGAFFLKELARSAKH